MPNLSGVAPDAYLGNYRVLTTPTPTFGLDGNGAEIARAIDRAVADGMDVLNLSLGEPEVGPRRRPRRARDRGAARAGVTTVVAAGNEGDEGGFGTVSSPGSAADAITVAAVTNDRIFALPLTVTGSTGPPFPVVAGPRRRSRQLVGCRAPAAGLARLRHGRRGGQPRARGPRREVQREAGSAPRSPLTRRRRARARDARARATRAPPTPPGSWQATSRAS